LSESFGILHSLFKAPNAYFCIAISIVVVTGFDKAVGNWQLFSKHLTISKIIYEDSLASKEEGDKQFTPEIKQRSVNH